MRSVSYWAKHNMLKARLLIVLSEIFLFMLAVRLGLLLLRLDIRLSDIAVVVSLSVLGLAALMNRYSKTLKQRNNKLYWRQRLCYFLVGLSMFLFTCFLVSSEKLMTWNTYSSLSGTNLPLLMQPDHSAGNRSSATQTKKVVRLLKKMQKHDSLKWVYISLIIVGGVFLLALVASLSCSLSCNGNGALAALVLLLGGGGVIFLCTWLIRKILKERTPKIVSSPEA